MSKRDFEMEPIRNVCRFDALKVRVLHVGFSPRRGEVRTANGESLGLQDTWTLSQFFISMSTIQLLGIPTHYKVKAG